MKKLLFVLLSIGLALGVSAQKGGVHRGGYVVRPRVSVGLGWGYAPFYPWYGSPWYSPWYGAPYAWGYPSRPSRLDLAIQDVKTDYADRIKSVRMQDDMTNREKRLTIRQLREDRDKAVVQTQKDYYYKRAQRNKPSSNNNSDNNNNNNNDSE